MIEIIQGNLLDSDCNVICHQCNCVGKMGAGIALEIRKRFPKAYEAFMDDYRTGKNILGNIGYTIDSKMVINMYSQNDIYPRGIRHTDYDAFRQCCEKIKFVLSKVQDKVRIGFPYGIGCGLAGGDWNIVSQILEEEFDGWDCRIYKI